MDNKKYKKIEIKKFKQKIDLIIGNAFNFSFEDNKIVYSSVPKLLMQSKIELIEEIKKK